MVRISVMGNIRVFFFASCIRSKGIFRVVFRFCIRAVLDFFKGNLNCCFGSVYLWNELIVMFSNLT